LLAVVDRGVLWACKRRVLGTRGAAVLWACVGIMACGDDAQTISPTRDASTADVPIAGEAGQAVADAMQPDATPQGGWQALTPEELRDPQACKDCHPAHYREWSSSMHAYAAQDPVFIAMNKRGQRETGGALGDFCVRCHAPMAVIDGLTTDGLNLDELADRDRGVSCYFCHNVVAIEGEHNAMLRLANDSTMRGPLVDALQPTAHATEYSELFDNKSPKSSAMCGACHDIVTPNGVHLERTFKEYKGGLSAQSLVPGGQPLDACSSCHMPERREPAAVYPGAVDRLVSEHLWPGIDVALTDFPNRDALRSAVEDCQLGQASVIFFTLEVTPPDIFTLRLETNAGHNQPSGSAQDRRMWLEFLAYDEDGQLLEDVSSGNIGEGEIEEYPPGHPQHDPQLLMFRDRIYDAHGELVHMFWQAASSSAYPLGYSSNTLVERKTLELGVDAYERQYRASGPSGELPARVTARLRIRPIGMDVLEDLIATGDLDPTVAQAMPTFTFGAQIEWTPEMGLMTPIWATVTTDCESYRCMLSPGSRACP
jgi:hypothetical protein